MTDTQKPTLHLLCGKVASGKSTLATQLSAGPGTILLQEDVWLSGLYGDVMHSLKDFVRCSKRLRDTLTPHIVDLLGSGTTVVLDFHANTLESRRWMRDLFEAADCPHQLHYLETPDHVCKERLRLRNLSGAHQFNVSEAEFDQISAHFQPPSPEEGFNLKVYSTDR